MRITFVMPPVGMSGGVRVVAEYAQRLRARGHRVAVVAQGARPPRLRYRVRDALAGKGWAAPSRRPSHFDGRDEGLTVLNTHRPITAADVPDADAVVATWWETAEWVAAMPASKGAPVYFLQHDESGLPGQPSERVRASWTLRMHRVAVSRWVADRVKDHAGGGVTVVPNSVDLDLFNAPPRGKQDVVTVGLMLVGQPWKGADIAAEAVAIARERLGRVRVVCFGPYDITADYDLGPDVSFVAGPAQQDIPALYARCDAWLFASRYEGFGLPLLESMACRTPVIGVPAGAAPELIEDGGGMLVRAEDPGAMADAIVELAGYDDAAWRQMSDRAYATASGYGWDEATASFEAQLRAAVGEREPAPEALPISSGRAAG